MKKILFVLALCACTLTVNAQVQKEKPLPAQNTAATLAPDGKTVTAPAQDAQCGTTCNHKCPKANSQNCGGSVKNIKNTPTKNVNDKPNISKKDVSRKGVTGTNTPAAPAPANGGTK